MEQCTLQGFGNVFITEHVMSFKGKKILKNRTLVESSNPTFVYISKRNEVSMSETSAFVTIPIVEKWKQARYLYGCHIYIGHSYVYSATITLS